MNKIKIIAEAGVNHNGDLALAKKLVDCAAQAGADCVKFQTFCAEQVISSAAPKAEYQKGTTGSEGSQLDMVKKLELSYDAFVILKEYCQSREIDFLSTPFDLSSIRFLDKLGLPFWKIPSGEVTNYPYLAEIGRTRRPVVMSTGMCTLEEIGEAMAVLRSHGTTDIRLLHCNTEYPTPFEDVNLRAMETLQRKFDVTVGYSDHTRGMEAAIAAAALGAAVIEKHFTLDRNMEGPDHKASLEPDELADMVARIRHVEQALGTGEKIPSPSEKKNMAGARKSIVAACPIKKGEVFSETNLTTKRPGTGISPMRWTQVLGTRAVRDFTEDELIKL